MGHIHTSAGQHDFTASAFIVRYDQDEPRLLLHQHKKLHKLFQPGGHVELNENPWQAVLHEIAEETGYVLSQLKLYQPKNRMRRLKDAVLHPQPVCINTHSFPTDPPHFHTDITFAFYSNGLPSNDVQDGESNELSWVSLDQLRQLPKEKIVGNVREIAEYVMTEILYDWELVELDEFAH